MATVDARVELYKEEKKNNPIKTAMAQHKKDEMEGSETLTYKAKEQKITKIKETLAVAKDVMERVEVCSESASRFIIKCLEAQIRKKNLPGLIESAEEEVVRYREALDLKERREAHEKREKKRQKKKDGKKRQLTEMETSGRGKRITPGKSPRLK